MLLRQAETGEAVDRKRLGHQPGARGAIEVPARETGGRPALQKDLEGFAVLGGSFKAFGQDDLTGRDRV